MATKVGTSSAYVPFSVIFARTAEGLFGRSDNTLPWHIPGDLKHFQTVTTSGTVIMGWRTWLSLKKPLKDRINIVVATRAVDEKTVPKEVEVVTSLTAALTHAATFKRPIFVIGGVKLLEEAFTRPDLDEIHLSLVEGKHTGDVYFKTPLPLNTFKDATMELVATTKPVGTTLVNYQRWVRSIDNDESTYLRMLQKVLVHGKKRIDRTISGTQALFGQTMVFDLTTTFPLFTTKRVWFKGVIAELLWFLTGDTNVRTLQAQGVKIWDEDAKRAAKLRTPDGKALPDGELGPIYGYQWRHFGGQYLGGDIKAGKGKQHAGGFDQIAHLIKELKTNPTSRRHVVTAWNPNDVSMSVLPPCHLGVDFDVEDGRLNCMFRMRSNDLSLGAPFNIASYAAKTVLLAALTDLQPGSLACSITNAHIYNDHVAQVKEQLMRPQRQLPKLVVDAASLKAKVGPDLHFDRLTLADFPIVDYHPNAAIKAAVPAEKDQLVLPTQT